MVRVAVRHQLAVLQRQLDGQRVRFDPADRAGLADVPIVPGHGTRLITYVNRRQMRKFEQYAGDAAVKEVKAELRRQGLPANLAPAQEAQLRKGARLYGAVKHVTLSRVQNLKALLQLHQQVGLRRGAELNQAILRTASIPYVSAILLQAGGGSDRRRSSTSTRPPSAS